MPSSRVLVVALVALLAASGKVPLLSKPVLAVVSLAFPSSSDSAGLFGGINGDGGGESARSSRLLTLAIRNATSDFDELTAILAEWFRSPEHGAADEAAFIDFLRIKAVRPHRSLERGLDWLLWLYRTLWPILVLALVARLTSPAPEASAQHHHQQHEYAGAGEEEGEGEEAIDERQHSRYDAAEEAEAELGPFAAAAANGGGGGGSSGSDRGGGRNQQQHSPATYAIHAHGGVGNGNTSGNHLAASTATAALQQHLSMLSPRAKAAVAHAAAAAGNTSPLGSDRSRGNGNGKQQQHRSSKHGGAGSNNGNNNAAAFADVLSRAAQAIGGGGASNGGNSDDAASAGGSSNGGGGRGGGGGSASKGQQHHGAAAPSPKLAAIRTASSTGISPHRGCSSFENDRTAGVARRKLAGGGGSGVIRASYS